MSVPTPRPTLSSARAHLGAVPSRLRGVFMPAKPAVPTSSNYGGSETEPYTADFQTTPKKDVKVIMRLQPTAAASPVRTSGNPTPTSSTDKGICAANKATPSKPLNKTQQSDEAAKISVNAKSLAGIQQEMNEKVSEPMHLKDPSPLGGLMMGWHHAALWTMPVMDIDRVPIGAPRVIRVVLTRKATSDSYKLHPDQYVSSSYYDEANPDARLLSDGSDKWLIDVEVSRETYSTGMIRLGDWQFPYRYMVIRGIKVCKLTRTRGVRQATKDDGGFDAAVERMAKLGF